MLQWQTTGAVEIPGFHGEIVASSPEIPTSSKYLWGLKGSVTIIGRQAKRAVNVEIWLNDPSWEQIGDFYAGVQKLESQIGEYGDLVVGPDTLNGVWHAPYTQVFYNMLFAGFEPLSFNGQDYWSPVQDEAACLYANSIVPADRDNQTWAGRFRLNFIQTLPGRTLVP